MHNIICKRCKLNKRSFPFDWISSGESHGKLIVTFSQYGSSGYAFKSWFIIVRLSSEVYTCIAALRLLHSLSYLEGAFLVSVPYVAKWKQK